MTRFSAQLRQAADPIWKKYFEHPFVAGMGDGSLEIEKFRHYMIQDFLYLMDYARVFALGTVKAGEEKSMRAFAESAAGILGGEMNLHRAYLRRLNVSEEAISMARPAMENVSYTSYMLSVAHAGGPAEIVAAILACSWSYAEIGQALCRVPGATAHPMYGEWVKIYSGEDYARENEAWIERMNDLAKSASSSQCEHLIEIFVRCSEYELDFWNMAWRHSAR